MSDMSEWYKVNKPLNVKRPWKPFIRTPEELPLCPVCKESRHSKNPSTSICAKCLSNIEKGLKGDI